MNEPEVTCYNVNVCEGENHREDDWHTVRAASPEAAVKQAISDNGTDGIANPCWVVGPIGADAVDHFVRWAP